MAEITEDIIRRAVQGDTNAFETIYRESSGFVFNVAFRVVHSTHDAEEVTQEVFLMVYDKLKHFRFESSLKTWMYRITINTAINMRKKWSRERNRSVELDEQVLPVTDAHRGGDDVRQTKDDLAQALLKHLNPDQKACLVLRSIEGLSYREIAQVLKININTVRSRLKRARTALMAFRNEVMANEL